ncbi:Gypsy retrotransposon integrase-like protein 1 [Marasmius sp. AFHP31]|nr:Gypsy retrotransposon integrase-like protein 1 [Marasmius sp. AFHP31]
MSPGQASSSTEEEVDEDFFHLAIAEDLKKLSLTGNNVHERFFGPASSFAIFKSAHGAKQEITGRNGFHSPSHYKRPYFWYPPAWERESANKSKPSFAFPDNSLLVSVVSLYFQHVNVHMPVLHEPTFKKKVMRGLHYENVDFGAVVLAVCALGARYSGDERAFAVPGHSLSAGWRWFEQLQSHHTCAFKSPCLYELQFHCLTAMYILGTSSPSSSWNMIGIGIRRGVELGAHRRTVDGHKLTVDDEQKKRTFWVLVVLDRFVCNFLGRPSAIRDEDFDLDLPIECDDEYWENEDPEEAFKQPPGKPSYVSSFVATVKLCEILSFALRTVFPIRKSQLMMGLLTASWEQKMVTELDSALNEWKSTLPEHLHWKSDREAGLFFEQSAFVHSLCHVVQIQAHRRFVQKSSPLSFASLAICTHSAKSCIHVLDALTQKNSVMLPHVVFLGFMSGCLLLTNVWGSKRAGVKMDYTPAAQDIGKLIRVFQSCENHWMIAGKFADLVYELSRGLDENPNPANENNGTTFFPDPFDSESSRRPPSDAGIASNRMPASTFGGDSSLYIQQGVSDYLVAQVPPNGFQAAGLTPSQTNASVGTVFDMAIWNELYGAGVNRLEDWTSYAENMSSLDLDAFMQNNPDIFQ